MEIESLFSSTRWDILKLLSAGKYSPLELSELLKTTSANVSQQLRLLELAGLVRSERVSASEKGKPRVVYTLSQDYSYLVLATDSFAQKKLMPLSGFHKFILRSWFIADAESHPLLLRLYLELEDRLDRVDAIYYNSGKREAYIVTEKDLGKIAPVEGIKITVASKSEASRLKYDVSLYDPRDRGIKGR